MLLSQLTLISATRSLSFHSGKTVSALTASLADTVFDLVTSSNSPAEFILLLPLLQRWPAQSQRARAVLECAPESVAREVPTLALSLPRPLPWAWEALLVLVRLCTPCTKMQHLLEAMLIARSTLCQFESTAATAERYC
jgi:hypothetical protein